MNRYIYKLTFESGKTYIGQRTFKGEKVEADSYLGSSTYHKNNPTDKIISKEILIENISDVETLNLLETICIMHEKAYNRKNNVNGTIGAYYFRFNAYNHTCSGETKKKMSNSAKKSWTSERRKQASESGNYKRIISEQQRKIHNDKIRNTKKIHKDGKELQVKETELSQYLDNGWKLGTLPFTNEHKEALKKASKDKGKGYKVLNKDGKITRVLPSEVEKLILEGWSLGTGRKPWNAKV